MIQITNIMPRYYVGKEGYKTRAAYTPAKKIDCGSYYIIYVSAIEPTKDEKTNTVLTNDLTEQSHQVFKEIEFILNNAGATTASIIKAVIYLTNMDDFKAISPIRAGYFEKCMPVSTLIEVSRLRTIGAKISIEVTAIINK